MSDACNRTPFWQRQPLLPRAVQEVLRSRLEAALADPGAREHLVWPTVLAAPRVRSEHPGGLPEPLLLNLAARMLGALGQHDPAGAWQRHRAAWPDTADAGGRGLAARGLLGRLGAPGEPALRLAAGCAHIAAPGRAVSPGLWCVPLQPRALPRVPRCPGAPLGPCQRRPSGAAAGAHPAGRGYHHLQQHNLAGALALWQEALERLRARGGSFATPWGEVRAATALDLTARRLDQGRRMDDDTDLAPLWALDRPTWELA